jgi:hypothetical protein
MSQTPEKRKIQPTAKEAVINGWGCLLAGIMLGLGFIVGIALTVTFSPQIFEFRRTEAALNQRETIIDSTEAALAQRAEAAQATQIAMGNDIRLLNQTATQSHYNIEATLTISAVESARRQTQIALDWEATQAQLARNATLADIDFRNTQAAFGLPIASTEAASVSVSSVLSYDFSQGILSNIWRSSAGDHWALVDNGIVAQRNGAWILSNIPYGGNYRVEVMFDPVLQVESDYFLLLGVSTSEGIALHIQAENLTTKALGFYRFDSRLLNENSLDIAQMQMLETVPYSELLQSQSRVSVIINGENIALSINDKPAVSATIPQLNQTGVIGVQMPRNTILRRISVGVN